MYAINKASLSNPVEDTPKNKTRLHDINKNGNVSLVVKYDDLKISGNCQGTIFDFIETVTATKNQDEKRNKSLT